MIFLIDDNRYEQQQRKFNANYLFDGSLETVLTTLYKLKLDEYVGHLEEKLQDAAAILLHNTFADADENGEYLDSSRIVRDYIVEDFVRENDIPIVLFSGSMSDIRFDDDDIPTSILGMNKEVFYQNLFEFLTHYKETNQLEMKILAYGKQYRIERILTQYEDILKRLAVKDKGAFFESHFVDLISVKTFYDLTKTNRSKDFEEFWRYLNGRLLTIHDFIQELEKIKIKAIKKYG